MASKNHVTSVSQRTEAVLLAAEAAPRCRLGDRDLTPVLGGVDRREVLIGAPEVLLVPILGVFIGCLFQIIQSTKNSQREKHIRTWSNTIARDFIALENPKPHHAFIPSS